MDVHWCDVMTVFCVVCSNMFRFIGIDIHEGGEDLCNFHWSNLHVFVDLGTRPPRCDQKALAFMVAGAWSVAA